MRHPLIDASSHGWLRLDQRELDQLLERAEAKAAEARPEVTRAAICIPTARVAYAEGVKAALGWIAGHHADDRLTELLDIDEDQR